MDIVARRVATVVVSATALGLLAVLISTSWGPASEYGSGGGSLIAFAILPIGAAAGAAGLAGGGRVALAALGVFAVVALVAVPVSAELGQRDRIARFQSADASFGCNGQNADVVIPPEVDAAFHVPAHPAGHYLYGPISGSRYGCTAAIHSDDRSASFDAWRRALLESGWRVSRDDRVVEVEYDGVRLRLERGDGIAMLTASLATGGDCAGGAGITVDGQVDAC